MLLGILCKYNTDSPHLRTICLVTIWSDNGADKMLFRSVLEDNGHCSNQVVAWSEFEHLAACLHLWTWSVLQLFPTHPSSPPSVPFWPLCTLLPLIFCTLPPLLPLADLHETASPLSRRKKIIKVRRRCRQPDQKSREAGENTGWLGALKHFVAEKVNCMLQAPEFWSRG